MACVQVGYSLEPLTLMLWLVYNCSERLQIAMATSTKMPNMLAGVLC